MRVRTRTTECEAWSELRFMFPQLIKMFAASLFLVIHLNMRKMNRILSGILRQCFAAKSSHPAGFRDECDSGGSECSRHSTGPESPHRTRSLRDLRTSPLARTSPRGR